MKGIHNKNSKFNFGIYKGEILGVIYVHAPSYIDWCINNIPEFCVEYLNELKELGNFEDSSEWGNRCGGVSSGWMGVFNSFQECIDSYDLYHLEVQGKFIFSEETLKLNEAKLRRYRDAYS